MLEAQAEYKSEYFDGEIYPMVDVPPGGIIGKDGIFEVAMAGASYRHVQIVSNTLIALSSQLKGKNCRPLANDLRTKASSSYTYPDIVVICGEPVFADKYNSVANPTVLIEVLSNSTEATDRTIKFEKYKQIESLREYLLIAQNENRFELFRRSEAGWLSETSTEKISLTSIGCELVEADVYEGVKFG